MASISKAKLVEQATKLGIKNAKDIPYGRLETLVRGAKKAKQYRTPYVSTSSTATSTSSVPKSNKNATSVTTTQSVPPQTSRPFRATYITSSRRLRVVIYRDTESLWRWKAIAFNGDIVADSGESYMTKWGTKRAAKRALGL